VHNFEFFAKVRVMAVVEVSSGGIVYRLDTGEPLILMIVDRLGRWSFPKGLVGRGEAPEAAARREVREETGIEGEVLHLLGETHYFYRRNGQLINKTVYFYLIRALSRAITPQLSEVADARWLSSGEALQRSSFPANTELLQKALAFLAEGDQAAGDLNLT
jgi:8-oxo-dGTP pyrophosphatase MutT (NUDIX family)